MLQRSKMVTLALSISIAGLLGITGCSDDSSSRLPFNLVSVSVGPSEQNFQLNRSIEFRFNRPVNPLTVSQNTINIAAASGETTLDPGAPGGTVDVGGLPAIGDFYQQGERTIVFQPSCPTSEGLLSGGLFPGVRYVINVPALSSNGIALAALSGGQGLEQGLSLTFRTSNSPNLTEAFLDGSSGPPSAIIRDQGGMQEAATRLELANDPTNRIYFERSAFDQPGRLQGGFLAPLNLYSSSASQVDLIVQLDQPVDPSPSNIRGDRIGLEFRSSDAGLQPEVWERFAATVSLDRNCAITGSSVRISPLGPLPQGRPLRLFISQEFRDLVGQTNSGPLNDFAVFEAEIAIDPISGVAGTTADEIFEDFSVGGPGSLEDVDAVFDVARAPWGSGGNLSAAFEFTGSGGQSGNFDVNIPPNTNFFFDTTSQVFRGGPGTNQGDSQVAIDGVLDCRNFFLPVSSSLRITGPNTARILATENVRIEGRISIDGNAAQAIDTLGSLNQFEPGAAGNGGGGQGGNGSPRIGQVSARGGNGSGAFQAADSGGQGGESGFTNNDVNLGANRRAAGGGGGRLGPDVFVSMTQGINSFPCRDQSLIGFDAEPGMTGSVNAIGATTGTAQPMGGNIGLSPFTDANLGNNFWGDLLVDPNGLNPTPIQGELSNVWAGAGGGAGGDATRTAIYPPTAFQPLNEQEGAGGGGGAGGFVILALGDISFGPQGRITATGGTGAGGENTGFSNRIGGGSGGGSGGHIVLQSASSIDFSEIAPTIPAISALGGQGGAGAGNLGGFDTATISTPQDDSKPPFADELALGCPPASNFTQGAGGDGSPGIVQLHAPNTASIIPPLSVDDFRSIILPSPLGLDLDEDRGPTWDGLLQLVFGSRSQARSVWIPLGGIHIDPGGSAAEMVEFLFEGIDPETGRVQTTDSLVPDLPAIINGLFSQAPSLPYLDADGSTIVVDLTLLTGTNDIYRRNPNLMRAFELNVTRVGLTETFQVASVDANETTGELRLTVDGANQPLQIFEAGDSFEIIPRFFRVQTGGVWDQLPASAAIVIRFQATTADSSGNPDSLMVTPLVSDPASLNAAPNNRDLRFFRFVVEFDISADGLPITPSTPLPSLDFLRFPFKF